MRLPRPAVLSLLLLCAALLFAACGDDESSTDDSRSAKDTTSEETHDEGDAAHDEGDDSHDDGTTTETTGDAERADETFSIAFAKGAVTGGPQVLKVRKGDTVAIKISSDVAGEAHLHGIDIDTEVPAGGTGTLTFVAKDQGSFELEDHESGALLATVNVS